MQMAHPMKVKVVVVVDPYFCHIVLYSFIVFGWQMAIWLDHHHDYVRDGDDDDHNEKQIFSLTFKSDSCVSNII